MPKQQPTVGPDDEDRRLLVIDLGGGVVHGVQTNIPELQGVKVLVLGDQKDSEWDRNEVVIEGTDWIVYQTERVAISECTWLLRSLTHYESQKVEDPP
jgi:ribulose kinase